MPEMRAEPVRVYGASISYFTGKLEAYLRYQEIPYEFLPQAPGRLLRDNTGAAQVPAVELPDGRWLTDTTPIITWFEREVPNTPIVPDDPLQAFVCRMIEDYADEWLWRPAMHYRWSFAVDKYMLSRKIVDEMTAHIPLPKIVKRFIVRQRQLRVFLTGDGVNASTRSHVEGGYLRVLDLMSTIFEQRPFVFGDCPTLADIGLMGPMLRHFSHDPTPAAIMLKRAPLVWEWVTRVWNARASQRSPAWVPGIPDDLIPLVQELSETHLAALRANALAWRKREANYDVVIQDTAYHSLPTSRYRVWCLEQLRGHFAALPESAAAAARALLEKCGGWDVLWEPDELGSGHDPDGGAPFCAGLEVLTAGRSRRARN